MLVINSFSHKMNHERPFSNYCWPRTHCCLRHWMFTMVFRWAFSVEFFQQLLETQRWTSINHKIWHYHLQLFDDAASFLGLIGMLIGVGNVISGAVFVLGAAWINKLNRTILLFMLVIENRLVISDFNHQYLKIFIYLSFF